MPRKEHHIVRGKNGGWDVKINGAKRATLHFETQEEAIAEGRRISQNQNSELVIHGKNGQIKTKNSHKKTTAKPKKKTKKKAKKVARKAHKKPAKKKVAKKPAKKVTKKKAKKPAKKHKGFFGKKKKSKRR